MGKILTNPTPSVGKTGEATIDRAAELEAKNHELRESLETIEVELKARIETCEFNSRHMIAENSLQDAWAMLDAAREQFQTDANSLQVPLAMVRSALSGKTGEDK